MPIRSEISTIQRCPSSSQSKNVKLILLLAVALCLCLSEAQPARLESPPTSQQQQPRPLVFKTIDNSETPEDRGDGNNEELARSQRQSARANLAGGDNDHAQQRLTSPGSIHINRRNVADDPSSGAAASSRSPLVDKSAAEEPDESGEAEYESSANGAGGVDYEGDAADSPPDAEEQPTATTASGSAANARPSRQSDSPPTMRPLNSPVRAPQQQPAASERMLQPTATTTTSTNNNNFASRAPPTLLQHQLQLLRNPTGGGQQRVVATTPPPSPLPPAATTFGASMGADRPILKSPLMPATAPTTTAAAATTQKMPPPTAGLSDLQETVATESVRHEVQVGGQQPNAASSQNAGSSNSALVHERRQDLLYPSNLNGGEESMMPASQSDLSGQPQNAGGAQANTGEQQQQQQEQAAMAAQMSSICQTPVALFTIIILTMLTTVFVCFCTHALVKHFGRHQFDLIATSKQYNDSADFGSGYLEGSAAASALERQANHCSPQQQAAAHLVDSKNYNQQVDLTGLGKNSCMLSIFGQQQQGGVARNEHGCAFENPYFNDEGSVAANSDSSRLQQQQSGYQQRRQQQLEQQFQLASQAANGRPGSTSLLSTSTNRRIAAPQAATALREPPNAEQLHFIEHHISNLHNRQVTSSVNELSLGNSLESNGAGGLSCHMDAVPTRAGQVVELTTTGGQRQATSPRDLKEGDLVAVDITGHDFIGLGFDVCGNERDGIFIDSVFSRGPAKESGCIEQGDRIKSLNVSFDSVTLQDAYDLLNCGSPYKMRLLLEKQALNAGALNSKQKHRPVQQQLLVNRLSAPPSSSAMVSRHNQGSLYQQQNSHRSVLSQQQLSSAGAGGGAILDSPLSVTKHYIKRLTNLVSPANSSSNRLDATRVDSSSHHDRCLLEQQQQPPVLLLGSAAARARHHSTASSNGPLAQSGVGPAHVNSGFKADDNDHEGDEQQMAMSRSPSPAVTTISGSGWRGRGREQKESRAEDSISSQVEELTDNKRRTNGSMGISLAEIFQRKTSLTDAAIESEPDSSLDYQNQNASHRLHGPQFNGSRSKKNKSLGGIGDVVELNLALGNRRQSALAETTPRAAPAATNGISGGGNYPATLHISNRLMMMNSNNLEQTQSQPEICAAFRDELRDEQNEHRQGYSDMTNSELAAATVKNADRDGQLCKPGVGGGNSSARNQKLMNNRLGSVSTPSMNVGSTTIHVQASGSSVNNLQSSPPANAGEASAVGPSRVSSSRRGKRSLMKRESIKEETHSVESDGDHSSSSKKSSSSNCGDGGHPTKTTTTAGRRTGTSNCNNSKTIADMY